MSQRSRTAAFAPAKHAAYKLPLTTIMSRITGPKARIVRRFGINLLGSEKYDKILAKRNFPPGVHGKGRFSKPTEFGKQLLEKQKIRFVYGLSERQCRNYYLEASKRKEDTGKTFMTLLEQRLDNVLYRAGFAVTRMQARQMVNHGLFLVKGRRITTPSYRVKIGDTFEVRTKNKNSPMLQELDKKKYKPPAWLNVDFIEIKGEIIRLPEAMEFEQILNPQAIVEFYSK